MATARPTQESLLAFLKRDHGRFISLISHTSDEEQQRPFTPEGWSIKDFIAHMTHWKAATFALLVAYVHDQPLPAALPSGDEANAQQREGDRAQPLHQVLERWEETHGQLQRILLDELNNDRLGEEVRTPWSEQAEQPICTIIEEICEHDNEHFDLIARSFPHDYP